MPATVELPSLVVYVVRLQVRKGKIVDVEVPSSLGPLAAARRAHMAAVAQRKYGDLDQVLPLLALAKDVPGAEIVDVTSAVKPVADKAAKAYATYWQRLRAARDTAKL